MIPYCDTPRQSLAIAIVRLVAVAVGVYLQNQMIVIGVAVTVAIATEIIVHEYREDEQYMAAKEKNSAIIQNIY